jgi:tripartite ATP-independent transporter DctM subunit
LNHQLASMLVLFGGILLGVDVAVAIGAAALIGFLLLGRDFSVLLADKFAEGLDSFPFLAIPLFILAGKIMSRGGIARQLVNVLLLAMGGLRGAMGPLTMLSTFVLSGVCGSASADTAAIGAVTIPEMRRRNYPMPFAAAVTAAAGATGHLLPPSIDLIVVGVVANLSIGALFLAGIIPALINLVSMIALTLAIALYRRMPAERESRQRWKQTLFKSLPALFMPVIILGGIRAGFFTPTEAACAAVVYGALVSLFVYGELRLQELPVLMVEACQATGAVLFVLGMANALSFLFTFEQVPQAISAFISLHASGAFEFLLIVNVIFLGVGMVMDALPALIVLMPILVPLAERFGLNPIHFSIIVLANVGLSFIHPPAGLCLYISAGIARIDIWQATKAIIPFFLGLLALLIAIAVFPELTLWLPRRFGLIR